MTERYVTFGQFLKELSKAQSFKQMSTINSGNLNMYPHTMMETKWAEAILNRLVRDGFAGRVFINYKKAA